MTIVAAYWTKDYYQELQRENETNYNDYLHVKGKGSAMLVPEVKAAYAEENSLNGFEVLNNYFKTKFF